MLTRRAFTAASLARVVSANDKIRFGVIGAGGISRADIKAFLLNQGTECVAICDVDDKQLAKRLESLNTDHGIKPETTKDYRRILDRKDIDVVVVCTPDHWHALCAIHACQAGKDVYCEKPLSTSIVEGRAMIEAVRQNKRVLQMGTQWRSGAHYKEAIDYVHSGKLGKVRQVRVWAYLDWVKGAGNPPDGPVPEGVDYDMWLGPAPKRAFNPNRFHFNFRWYWDYAGGLMTDWGVHLINVALWGMGKEAPKEVISSGGRYVLTDNTETPDTQIAVYEFPTYRMIFEHQIENGLGPDRREHGIAFTGSEATLIVDQSGFEVIPEPSKKGAPSYAMKSVRGADGRTEHAGNFLECVRSRQEPVENVEVGHHVTTVAALGNLAFRTRSRVEWDAVRERCVNNKEADRLLLRSYRKPWSLPYAKS